MVPRKHNLLYLTGFMGSGKSTIAPILANTLGYTHFDVDREIERRSGKPISSMFAEDGEDAFRNIERTVLRESAVQEDCVVSLGGGTITNDENLLIVRSSGILIYLKADIDHIFARVRHKDNRPLLRSISGERLTDEELRSRIASLMMQREPFYNTADIIIMTDERRVGVTVDTVVKRLHQFIGPASFQ